MGYFGYGNVGDEAILEYELRDLQFHFPLYEFIVITDNFKNEKSILNLKCIPQEVGHIVKEHFDLILWGGGWILYDTARNKQYFRKEVKFLHRLSEKLSECRIILYGVSVGPIVYKRDVDLALKARLQHVISFAIVRDKFSGQQLIKIGFTDKQILRGADLGYEVIPLANPKTIIEDSNFIVLSLSNYVNLEKIDIKDIIRFCQEIPEKIILLPAQYSSSERDDLRYAENLQKKIGDKSRVLKSFNRAPEEIAGILAKAKYVITNRLHIAILSSISGTPVIGISCPNKLTFFYNDIRKENLCLQANQISVSKLRNLATNICNHRKSLSRDIQQKVSLVRQKALIDAQRLEEIIGKFN